MMTTPTPPIRLTVNLPRTCYRALGPEDDYNGCHAYVNWGPHSPSRAIYLERISPRKHALLLLEDHTFRFKDIVNLGDLAFLVFMDSGKWVRYSELSLMDIMPLKEYPSYTSFVEWAETALPIPSDEVLARHWVENDLHTTRRMEEEKARRYRDSSLAPMDIASVNSEPDQRSVVSREFFQGMEDMARRLHRLEARMEVLARQGDSKYTVTLEDDLAVPTPAPRTRCGISLPTRRKLPTPTPQTHPTFPPLPSSSDSTSTNP